VELFVYKKGYKTSTRHKNPNGTENNLSGAKLHMSMRSFKMDTLQHTSCIPDEYFTSKAYEIHTLYYL
jgi:hypothetical protein